MAKEKDGAPQKPTTPAGSVPAGSTEPVQGSTATHKAANPADGASREQLQAMEKKVRRTRISSTWVAIIVAIVLVILMLIFILQNLRTVTVTYFGGTGQLPLGVALLFAAIGGAALVAIVGMARLGQLRLNARQRRRAGKRSDTDKTGNN